MHSPRHLINELTAVEKRAGDAVYSEHTAEVVKSIRLLQADAEQRFADKAEVWLALARAYAEAGAVAPAVKAYRDAIEKDTKSERSVRTIDAYRQLANLEARVAPQRAQREADPFDFGRDEHGVTEDPAELFDLAEKRLDDLAPLDQSAEWHAIKGSLFKKRASTLTGDAQRDELRRSMDALPCRRAGEQPAGVRRCPLRRVPLLPHTAHGLRAVGPTTHRSARRTSSGWRCRRRRTTPRRATTWSEPGSRTSTPPRSSPEAA